MAISISLPFFVLLNSYVLSIFQGVQDFRHYNFIAITQPAITLISVIVLVWGFGLGLSGAIISFIIGCTCTISLALYFLRTQLWGKKTAGNNDPERYVSKSLNYGLKAHLGSMLQFLNYKIDIFLINFFLNPAETGIYVIAVQIIERLWLFSQAASTVILPRLSQLHASEKNAESISLAPLVGRWVLLSTLLGGVVFALMAESAIFFIFGDEYARASTILLWLIPGIIIASLTRVLANDIAARGRPELNLYIAAAVLIFNVSGNIILIPQSGIVGAAIVTSLSYLLSNILTIATYYRLGNKERLIEYFFDIKDWRVLKNKYCR